MIPGLIYVAINAECSCAWLGGSCDMCYVKPPRDPDGYDPDYDDPDSWRRMDAYNGLSPRPTY